jgi:hypothetical protein
MKLDTKILEFEKCVLKKNQKIKNWEEPGSNVDLEYLHINLTMLKRRLKVLFKREEFHNTGSNPMMCR